MDKICEFCNKPFKTYQSRQRFCSNHCSRKDRYKIKKKAVCSYCSKEFIIKQGSLNGNRFCSRECYYLYKTKERVPIICKNCGKVAYFSPAIAKNRINCSKKCRNEQFSKESSKRFKNTGGKNHHAYKNGNAYYRKDARINFPNKCIACGRNKVALRVHHIDGNRVNNDLINLVILCKSCHMRVHKMHLKYNITLPQSLEVAKLTGHLPKKWVARQSAAVVAEIEKAVESVVGS